MIVCSCTRSILNLNTVLIIYNIKILNTFLSWCHFRQLMAFIMSIEKLIIFLPLYRCYTNIDLLFALSLVIILLVSIHNNIIHFKIYNLHYIQFLNFANIYDNDFSESFVNIVLQLYINT